MPSPFPGFDPFLENPDYWRGFHNNFITFLNEALNATLPPGFAASTEERVSIDAVAEPYIEILALGAEEEVVTIIEILSPTNKTNDGHGRDSYVRKQEQILHSDVHLLEIDLLRDGLHTVAVSREALLAEGHTYDYLVSLHRGGRMLTYEYWPIALPSRLPRVRVPLTEEYPDLILDLQTCFDRTYDAGPYRRRLDYRRPPTTPLSPESELWADTLLRSKGLRPGITPN